ncbi:inhibitor of apoptosis - 2 [Rachiplusia ou multiple nucleopolyhedrovirus]|uniref:Inhibitor of apoptosis-2 n=1 Tax=Rachiplusia ou multiple nucleopolyhedrovirus (strain R1) TaxID=654904 RepID=Q8B9I1_NPVR1|nr:inhibitor of apoptosis - 2 [Rachiplusia ou multiple nucleopolyhedrovirus]AAN28078.1 inhibitor of apoptosis - 2 [Rachiplusia ou multiple nucleopolyhedrovirus]
MNLMQFNFLILSTDGRFRTMANMSLDNEYKLELAKTGLFFHNNLIKCIGCRTILNKINAKQIKRHTYSNYCISSTNALMFNESMRKKSFTSFKSSRRQFASQSVVVDMLARRGFYYFGKAGHLRCSGCYIVFKYKSVDDAQRRHQQNCKFLNAIEDYSDNEQFGKFNAAETEILAADLIPPRLNVRPSAPPAEPLTQQVSECKVCFDREKSVCFMPCRHLAVCTTCSRRCKRCCVCNAKIIQRIETLPQ